MDLRKAVEIPFINEAPLAEILGAKLPTGSMVFRHLWHHQKVLHKTHNIAVRDTAKAVIEAWAAAGLTAKKIDCIIKDIEKMFKQHEVISLHYIDGFELE